MLLANVNLAAGWTTVWSAIQSAIGSQVTALLTAIGVILVVGAILKWIWDRRRGGGGNHSHLLYTLLIGGILAAPDFIIPVILTILDTLINVIVSIGSRG